MNKKQKALLVGWMIMTSVVGIYVTVSIYNGGYYRVPYMTQGGIEMFERYSYHTGAVLSAWATATVILGGSFAICASKKSN